MPSGPLVRVGLIVPSSNVVVEETIQRRGRWDAIFHVARLPVVAVDMGAGSQGQFAGDPLDQAVDRLAEAGVDRIVFAGTAGAWLGVETDRAFADRTVARTGIAATTTTLLCIAALRQAGVGRLVIVTPFLPAVHDQIERTFEQAGFDVRPGACMSLGSSRKMADAPPDAIARLVEHCGAVEEVTVLCFCTNFRGMESCAFLDRTEIHAKTMDSVEITLRAGG